MSSQYQRILDQIEAEWKKSPLSDADARRDVVVTLVLDKLGMSRPWCRALVEALYDRLFSPANNQTPEIKASEYPVCPECGLNDGHHYVGCKRSLLRQ